MDGVSIQLVTWQVREATFVHTLHLGQICNLQTVQFNMEVQKNSFIRFKNKQNSNIFNGNRYISTGILEFLLSIYIYGCLKTIWVVVELGCVLVIFGRSQEKF